jgi:UDP-N-acetyl-D-glucosamine dehydrogenase
MQFFEKFNQLVDQKNAVIGIIGLGYIGLPLSLAFVKAGYKVIGFDIDYSKKIALENGQSYLLHIDSDQIKEAKSCGLFQVECTFEIIAECDAIILCLPTPLNTSNGPDLSYIKSSINSISPFLRKGQLISLESTTYPGTTEELLLSNVKSLGFDCGNDFFVVYSPEREDPGNLNYGINSTPKVVGGITKQCLDLGKKLYGLITPQIVPVSSTQVAELVKLHENIFRAVNISMVNEMKKIAHALGINIYEVIAAASTKPFGFTPFFPGPGLGGHCIPIDPFYLSWKAKTLGIDTKFINLAGEIDSSMPHYVVDIIIKSLNEKQRPVNGSKILAIGLSYKKNVNDLRESPSCAIINNLLDLSAKVDVYDPLFKKLPDTRKWKAKKPKFIENLSESILKRYDLCVLITDHDVIDYKIIYENSSIIVDCRGRFEPSARVKHA